MADQDGSASLGSVALSIFNKLWGWTGTSETWRKLVVSVVLVVVLLWALTVFFGALRKAFDSAFKLIEAFKSSGLPRFMKREDRIKVRRRTQFCAVLEADLTNIAKAESWNDQYFTDLEAEVETEGGYYISSLHRLFGRISTGLRKEKSLIKAISSSSERAIQLTGEPGAGKSVALRHLASQLAVRAKTSKAKDALVPLYINLREIEVSANLSITTDTIRDFILDNIRRGDSDTTAYVRENWADYRERGIWFFLFDSFDEIPAVLHAEKGSPVTKEYAEAIRKFLEGMGECRGILASREFKGPESLPWKKFRILRLTSGKQRELVANAFLSQAQEREVLHHLATSKSTLANTPLFLTLLCRYVKGAKTAPKNDYELLSLQIDGLAHRDPAYLRRIYGLDPAELLKGAQRIARLFAEESSLGLAPTIDQVETVLNKAEVPGGDIQRFVAAMVDAKIARADVANAALGDRRFAFAHRRYQEALFVRHLVAHPGYLSGYDLLTEPRWREYAVTLLQTQPDEALIEMFEAAVQILVEATDRQYRRDALIPLSDCCGYFEWTSESTQMLNLLQEGLARRVSIIPEMLSTHVEKFLKVRWETGDSFDRMMVVRVATLLPQATLSKYLEETFLVGSDKAQSEGFNHTTALVGEIPSAVKQAVLDRLADEILGAKDASALLRMEALVARLPRDLGAGYVYRRCVLLRKLTNLVSFTGLPTRLEAAIGVVTTLFTAQENKSHTATQDTKFALLLLNSITLYVFALLFMVVPSNHSSNEMLRALQEMSVVSPTKLYTPIHSSNGIINTFFDLLLLVVPLLITIFPIVLFRFRTLGEPLNVGFFIRRMRRRISIFETAKMFAWMLLIMGILGATAYVFGIIVSFAANHALGLLISAPTMVVGIVAMALSIWGLLLIFALLSFRRKREMRRWFDMQFGKFPDNPLIALLSSQTWKQFQAGLSYLNESVHHEATLRRVVDDQIRSISAALQHIQRGGYLRESKLALADIRPNALDLVDCINLVEDIRDSVHARQPLEGEISDVVGQHEASGV